VALQGKGFAAARGGSWDSAASRSTMTASGVSWTVEVSPAAAAAACMVNNSARQPMVSSRPSGSLTGRLRVRSARSTMLLPSQWNAHGWVVWSEDGAMVAATRRVRIGSVGVGFIVDLLVR